MHFAASYTQFNFLDWIYITYIYTRIKIVFEAFGRHASDIKIKNSLIINICNVMGVPMNSIRMNTYHAINNIIYCYLYYR